MTDIDFDTARFSQHAATVTSMAARHGWPLPSGYERVRDLATAAAQARDTPAAIEPAPTTAGAVGKWLTKTADARVRHAERQRLAGELAETSQREADGLLLAAAPGFVAALVEPFDKALAEFKPLAVSAPRAIHAGLTDAAAAEHVALLNVTHELSAITQDRFVLAGASGERMALGHDVLWVLLEPADEDRVTIRQVIDVLDDFRSTMPTSIDDWARLADVGVSLAGHGMGELRRGDFEHVREQSGMVSADGGLADRSITEARRLIGQPVPATLAAST
jgi:hypothetical protein